MDGLIEELDLEPDAVKIDDESAALNNNFYFKSSTSNPACFRIAFSVPFFNSSCRGTAKTRSSFCMTT